MSQRSYAFKIDEELARDLPNIVFSDEDDNDDLDEQVPILQIYERPADMFSTSSMSELDPLSDKEDSEDEKSPKLTEVSKRVSECTVSAEQRIIEQPTLSSRDITDPVRVQIPSSSDLSEENKSKSKRDKNLQRTLFYGVQSVEMAQELVKNYSSAAPISLTFSQAGSANLDEYLEKDIDEVEMKLNNSLIGQEWMDVTPTRNTKAERDLVMKLQDIAESYSSRPSLPVPPPSEFILNGGSYVAMKEKPKTTICIDLRQDQQKSFSVEVATCTTSAPPNGDNMNATRTQSDFPARLGWEDSSDSSSEDDNGGNQNLWLENYRKTRQTVGSSTQQRSNDLSSLNTSTQSNDRQISRESHEVDRSKNREAGTNTVSDISDISLTQSDGTHCNGSINTNRHVESTPQTPPWVQQKINQVKQREQMLANKRKLQRILEKCRPKMQLHDSSLFPLYHEESSYNATMKLLPANITPSTEKLFELTIHMKAPGVIVTRPRGGRLFDEDDLRGVSLSFSVLMAWLASLTFSPSEFRKESSTDFDLFEPPFYVVCMEMRGCKSTDEMHLQVLCVGRRTDCNIRQLRFFFSQHTLKQAAPNISQQMIHLCQSQQIEYYITKLFMSAFIHVASLNCNADDNESDEDPVVNAPDTHLQLWMNSDHRSPFWYYSDVMWKSEGVQQWPVCFNSSGSTTLSSLSYETCIVRIDGAVIQTKQDQEEHVLCCLFMNALLWGLSIAGVRLVYSPCHNDSKSNVSSSQDPTLVIAFRGVDALASVGKLCRSHPLLMTICSQSQFFYTEEVHLIEKEAAYWFGPRLKCLDSFNVEETLSPLLETNSGLYPSSLIAVAPSDFILLTSTAVSDVGWIIDTVSSTSTELGEGPVKDCYKDAPISLQCIGCKRVFIDDVDTLIQLGLTESESQKRIFTGVCHLLIFRSEQAYSLHGWRLIKRAFELLRGEVPSLSNSDSSSSLDAELFFSCFQAYPYLIMLMNTLPNFYQLPRAVAPDEGVMRAVHEIIPVYNNQKTCDTYGFVVLRGDLSSYQMNLSIVLDQCNSFDLLGVQVIPYLPPEHEELLESIFGSCIHPVGFHGSQEDVLEPDEMTIFVKLSATIKESDEDTLKATFSTSSYKGPVALFLYRGYLLEAKLYELSTLMKTQPNVIFGYSVNNHLVFRLGMAFFRQCDLHSNTARHSQFCTRKDNLKGIDLLQAMKSNYSPREWILTITRNNKSKSSRKGGDSSSHRIDTLHLLCQLWRVLDLQKLKAMELHYFPQTSSDESLPLFVLKVVLSSITPSTATAVVTDELQQDGVVNCQWDSSQIECSTNWKDLLSKYSEKQIHKSVILPLANSTSADSRQETLLLLFHRDFIEMTSPTQSSPLLSVLEVMRTHKLTLLDCRLGGMLAHESIQSLLRDKKISPKHVSGREVSIDSLKDYLFLLLKGELAISALSVLLSATKLPQEMLNRICILPSSQEIELFLSKLYECDAMA